MSRYRGIQTDIWDNEWFAEQDKDLQFYWLFLLTNQWTENSGIYRMREGIEALYCHGDRTVVARWRESLSTEGKARFEGNWVYIPTYVEKQATPNVPMWKSMLDQIANAPAKFVEDWLKRYESEIPDSCEDRLRTVKAQCGHGDGTVQAGCDNVNVNVNVNENENGNGEAKNLSFQQGNDSPQTVRERWKEVIENPHCWNSSLLQPGTDYLDRVVDHHSDVWNVKPAKKTTMLVKRILQCSLEYRDEGKTVVLDMIRKAHRLSEDDAWWRNGTDLKWILSEEVFEKLLRADDPRENNEGKVWT